jgi:hypothetical protein
MAAHVAGAEHFWIAEVTGHRPETRKRPADFATVAISSVAMSQLPQETSQETRDAFSTLGESDVNATRRARHRAVALRWCMVRVIDHTSLRLSHMQTTYRLWSGGNSFAWPPGFECLSPKQDS